VEGLEGFTTFFFFFKVLLLAADLCGGLFLSLFFLSIPAGNDTRLSFSKLLLLLSERGFLVGNDPRRSFSEVIFSLFEKGVDGSDIGME